MIMQGNNKEQTCSKMVSKNAPILDPPIISTKTTKLKL
jgi:hypothetical protein